MASLAAIYRALLARYGPQHWWPGETDFEIAIGAILAQNVSWTNVEKAIGRLKEEKLLAPRALHRIPGETLALLIRPTGYYNQKAKKLRNFLDWFARYGYSFARLRALDTGRLRSELLTVNGIGPETADSILLYALEKKVFVVDAYTFRIFGRIGMLRGGEGYDEVQRLFHRRFRAGTREYNEYHALIVNHGKYFCKKTPLCGECCLARLCGCAA
ncbi:MAG TPA: endonuclease III domain-containing protein [Spirochaetota bacterium]|nr:endonuclease III domain-containing protein [Spirochaetota bacterium]